MERSIQKVRDVCKTLDTSPVETDTITFDPCSISSLDLGKLYTDKNPSYIQYEANLRYVIQNQKVSFCIIVAKTANRMHALH